MSESIGTTLGSFLKERLTNPLLSSFAIAWSLYNYKFYVILFSKNTVSVTSELIRQRFPDLYAIALHGIIVPACFAALYLFVSPYLTAWYYSWLRERQRKVDDARYAIESAQRLTADESRAIRALARTKDAQIDQLENEIVKLKADLREGDNKIASANEQVRTAALALESSTSLEEELKRVKASLDESREALAKAEETAEYEHRRRTKVEEGYLELEKQMKALSASASPATQKVGDASPMGRLDRGAISLFEVIANNPGWGVPMLAAHVNVAQGQVKQWLASLVEHEYVRQSKEQTYAVTEPGRLAWIKLRGFR